MRIKLKLIIVLAFAAVGLVLTLSDHISYAESNSLTVSGNKVLQSNGRQFIPEGISIYGGLEGKDYTNLGNDCAQIKASALYWHANTVRLQVSESNLFSRLKKGQAYNPKFFNLINNEVAYAHKFGLVVVLNDQTEFTNETPAPTQMTIKFWQVMSSKYKSDPYVIFDIFNEPRLTNNQSTNPSSAEEAVTGLPSTPAGTLFIKRKQASPPPKPHNHKTKHVNNDFSFSKTWNLWKYGGFVNKKHYVGMQTLVNKIRSSGANNIIWVEGSYTARVLSPVQYLLTGSNLVYSIHHPDLNMPSSWNMIGQLARKVPVVEGEWSQYESDWAECYSKAYTNAPKYIKYLQAHNVGIIAWSLQSGSLLRGSQQLRPSNLNDSDDPIKASELRDPSRLTPNYSCNGVDHGQGVGQLLMNYFNKNSAKVNI